MMIEAVRYRIDTENLYKFIEREIEYEQKNY